LGAPCAAARLFGAAVFAGFFVLAAFFATFLRPTFIPLSMPERAHL
jgi:multidrug efflux pump subunit AcrB